MTAINKIAKEWADELRDGIVWLIVWKTGRSWNAEAVWLDCDDTFGSEELEVAHKVLEQDASAIMLNGYYCGHLGEDMTIAELAAGIRWHYENGYNMLSDSTAFPSEPVEYPEELPVTPLQNKTTNEEQELSNEVDQQQESNGCTVTEYIPINDHNDQYSNMQGNKLRYRYFLPLLLPLGIRGPPITENPRKSILFRMIPRKSQLFQIIPNHKENRKSL